MTPRTHSPPSGRDSAAGSSAELDSHASAKHVEDLLDAALAETFPASDPVSIAMDATNDSPRPKESENGSAPR